MLEPGAVVRDLLAGLLQRRRRDRGHVEFLDPVVGAAREVDPPLVRHARVCLELDRPRLPLAPSEHGPVLNKVQIALRKRMWMISDHVSGVNQPAILQWSAIAKT